MNRQDQESQMSRKVGAEVFTSRRSRYDPAAWARAHAQKIALASFMPFEVHLGAIEEERIRAAGAPTFLPLGSHASRAEGVSDAPEVEITSVENPAPRASLGYAGPVVKLDSEERFFQGVLTFPIDTEKTRAVAGETIRVFRWRGGDGTFEPAEPGGLADGYAWARISSPGIYTLIGLPADPFKQTLIRVTSAMAPTLAGMEKQDRDALLRAVGRTLANPAWFKSFSPRTMQLMFGQGWMPEPGFGFGFGGFPEDGESLPRGSRGGDRFPGRGGLERLWGWIGTRLQGSLGSGLPGRPNWAGWEPGDDICPPMPWGGWPERWLFPLIEEWWRHPVGNPFLPIELGWVHQGPINLPGHSTEVQIDPHDPNRIYTSTANGGLWVLDDVRLYPTGSTWRPLTDLNENLNLQCLAIAPSDSRVLYYADGASRLFRSDTRGGMWARASDTTFDLANRILVDPEDADTIYLATEGGFFRSTNRGQDWDLPLYSGAVVDAVMDHQDSRIIYLGVRNVGIVKTTTGGTGASPWTTVFGWSNASSPTGTEIRLALGRQRTAATRTVVARFDQEVFVNKNGGIATRGASGWSSKGKVGGDGYRWWCFALGVSPHDDRIILAGSQDLFRTVTGGAPWEQVGGYGTDVHADFWDVTFDPTQTGVVYCANDGGVYRSTDSGSTWRYLENKLASAQLYATGVNGGRAMSGMYHQGIVASRSLSTKQWQGIEGGAWEFSKIHADPKRPYYFYVFSTKLHRRRWPNAAAGANFDLEWGNFTVTSLGVDPRPGSGVILCGARDPEALKRTTMADSTAPAWTDETVPLAAGEIVTSVAFVPSQPGMAYVITNQGRVFRKDDVSSSSPWALASTWSGHAAISLAVDPNDSQRLYAITRDTIGMLDLAGPGWSIITGSAPDALPTGSPYVEVVAHERTSGVVFVALGIGVFITVDNGSTWRSYENNANPGSALPNAPIQDINWSGGSLYAVCHGRGLWRRSVVL